MKMNVGIALSGLLVSGLHSHSLAIEEDRFHAVVAVVDGAAVHFGFAYRKKNWRLKFATIVRFEKDVVHIVPIHFSVLEPLRRQNNTYLLPVRHFFDSRIAIVGFIDSRSRC